MQSTTEEEVMSSNVVNLNEYRELAHRATDGIEVTLFWNAQHDELSVEVLDHGADNVFYLPVARDRAMDAFNHPYAYAASQGVEYEAPVLEAA
jgi:hypothetical protein